MKFIYKTLLLSLFSGLVFSSCDDFVEDVDIVDPTAENSDDYLPVEFLTSVAKNTSPDSSSMLMS